jgi:predicted nucleotidyltransferase
MTGQKLAAETVANENIDPCTRTDIPFTVYRSRDEPMRVWYPADRTVMADLAEIQAQLTSALEGATGVRWACLFGSAARGEPFRDLDVGVMLDDSARGAVAFGRIAADLQAAVPQVELDLVDLESLAPAVAGRISRERVVLIDRDPTARKSWEVESNRRALDIEPWHREFERLRFLALEQRRG